MIDNTSEGAKRCGVVSVAYLCGGELQMSLGELEAYYPEQLTKRALKQNLLSRKRRAIQNAIKTKRRAMTTLRRQYYVTTAISDVRLAASRNEDIFLASLLIITAVSFSLASTAANVIFAFMQAAAELSDVSGLSIALLVLAATGVLVVMGSWILSFLLNMLIISIMEGATRKVNRSLRSTARKSLLHASRVASVWYTLGALVYGPLGISALALVIGLHKSGVSSSVAVRFAIGYTVVALVWVGVLLARYSLAPYIAVFEPKLSLGEAFDRSRELTAKRGRWFVIADHLCLVLALGLAYLLALGMQYILHIDAVLPFSFMALLILLGNTCVMTMFYRKRKLARS